MAESRQRRHGWDSLNTRDVHPLTLPVSCKDQLDVCSRILPERMNIHLQSACLSLWVSPLSPHTSTQRKVKYLRSFMKVSSLVERAHSYKTLSHSDREENWVRVFFSSHYDDVSLLYDKSWLPRRHFKIILVHYRPKRNIGFGPQ